jgi:tripartite-type tricarboxylate transporter receptor subunit TctC
MTTPARTLGLSCFAAFLVLAQARAADVADFWRGRTVQVVIGYSVGGGYDLYARLLAENMGRHIPGNPTLVPQNMLGAGSLKAANYLYMERGEIDGLCGLSWSTLKGRHTQWLADKSVHLLVQAGIRKSSDLPDVPLLTDLATDPEKVQILKFIVAGQGMARPFVAPPGIPEDRKAALRVAFEATMRDPDFLAEAKRQDIDVNPVSGDEIDAMLKAAYATPKPVITQAAEAMAN